MVKAQVGVTRKNSEAPPLIKNKRLLAEGVTDDDVRYLTARFLPKPIVAALTIGFAYFGILVWCQVQQGYECFTLGCVDGREGMEHPIATIATGHT